MDTVNKSTCFQNIRGFFVVLFLFTTWLVVNYPLTLLSVPEIIRLLIHAFTLIGPLL